MFKYYVLYPQCMAMQKGCNERLTNNMAIYQPKQKKQETNKNFPNCGIGNNLKTDLINTKTYQTGKDLINFSSHHNFRHAKVSATVLLLLSSINSFWLSMSFVMLFCKSHVTKKLWINPFQRRITMLLWSLNSISMLLFILVMIGMILWLRHFLNTRLKNVCIYNYKLVSNLIQSIGNVSLNIMFMLTKEEHKPRATNLLLQGSHYLCPFNSPLCSTFSRNG